MTPFIQFVNRLSQLENTESEDFQIKLNSKIFNKNDHLLKSGEVCRNLYFIDKGLTKTYFHKGEKEFIMRFFPENSMFTVLDSFLAETPSTYSILALEQTTITYISKAEIDRLCKSHPSIETFFRKLVSLAAVNMMNRVSELLEENGKERYNNFLKENSHLLQRISLGNLAAYLGMTQVSLSRIRASK